MPYGIIPPPGSGTPPPKSNDVQAQWLGPAIGAVASVGGGLLGGKGQRRAAEEQRRAQQEQLAFEREREAARQAAAAAAEQQYQQEYADWQQNQEQKWGAWQSQIGPWQQMAKGILAGHYGGSPMLARGNLAGRRAGATLGSRMRARKGGGR